MCSIPFRPWLIILRPTLSNCEAASAPSFGLLGLYRFFHGRDVPVRWKGNELEEKSDHGHHRWGLHLGWALPVWYEEKEQLVPFGNKLRELVLVAFKGEGIHHAEVVLSVDAVIVGKLGHHQF